MTCYFSYVYRIDLNERVSFACFKKDKNRMDISSFHKTFRARLCCWELWELITWDSLIPRSSAIQIFRGLSPLSPTRGFLELGNQLLKLFSEIWFSRGRESWGIWSNHQQHGINLLHHIGSAKGRKVNVRDFASKIIHTVRTKYAETWQGLLKYPVRDQVWRECKTNWQIFGK